MKYNSISVENNINLPDGVGPHEGRELLLMLAGEKKIAYVQLPPDDFEPYIQQGIFYRILCGEDGHIIYHPSYENEAKRLHTLILDSWGKGFMPEIEREIGELLGYTSRDIEVYLKHAEQVFKLLNATTD
jgi:hypothetical protein